MSDVVDLDALIPQRGKIKFDGNEHDVDPPTVASALRIAGLYQKSRLAEVLEADELEKTIADLEAEIRKCIPTLPPHTLNYPQLVALVELLTKMQLPPDAKELADRGITKDSPKAPQTPSE